MISFFNNFTYPIQAFIASLFTFGITALGSSIVIFFKKINDRILNGLLALAAGIMLAATFWSLLEPGLEMAENLNMIPWLVALIGIIGGTILLIIGDKVFSAYQKKKKKSKNLNKIIMLIFSITLHNIPEGLAIGVAFGSLKYNLDGVTLLSAISLAIGIGIQNFPEGSAISLPLRSYGFSRSKSFIIGMLSGIVEPISAVIGALLVIKMRFLLPILLTFAAGAMLYVVIKELIPESTQDKNPALMTTITIFGFLIMMCLDVALG
ncbi:MAG: ZIP family metal transporter [Bacilli bacterium]